MPAIFSAVPLSFTPQQLEDLREFLSEMDSSNRRRGEEYFKSGRVGRLDFSKKNTVTAMVKGSRPYVVNLSYDPDEVWLGECTCPVADFECKHQHAAGLAVLARFSKGNTTVQAAVFDPQIPVVNPSTSPSFFNDVSLLLNRPLTPAEHQFLQNLSLVHNRCQVRGKIQQHDFVQMGFAVRGNLEPIRHHWKTIPTSLSEFWEKVALTLLAKQVPIPEFLQPITNPSKLHSRMDQLRRHQEVEKWKRLLEQTRWNEDHLAMPETVPIDLRIRIEESQVRLEWIPPGQVEFAPLTRSQMETTEKGLVEGWFLLSPQAEALWEAFQPDHTSYFGPEPTVPYKGKILRSLRQFFSLEIFHPRLVNASGQPLSFPKDPLYWSLGEPLENANDYTLTLVQPNGEKPSPVFLVLKGSPAFYLTSNVIYRGPNVHHEFLSAHQENRIPVAALESTSGVRLLQSLKIPLPERVQKKVAVVPMFLKLTAQLEQQLYSGSREVCLISASAEAQDGSTTWSWSGVDWIEPWDDDTPADQAERNKRGEAIRFHDRTRLQNPTHLLKPLDAKWEGYRGAFTFKLTKKFPEMFSNWLKSLPPEVKVELAGDLASFKEEAMSGVVKLEATETEIDWFDLRVVINVADTTLTAPELDLLLKGRGGYVRLEGKGWKRLKFELDPEDDERLARLGLTPKELSEEPMKLHALQLADESARRFLPEEQVEKIQRRAAEIKTRVTPEIPATVQAELRPYQLEGFHFLAYLSTNHFGGILADDMGLGKTLQALTWLQWLRAETNGEVSGKAKRPSRSKKPGAESSGPHLASLVVCPKSVTDNWRAEAERFAPGLRVKIWTPGELAELPKRVDEADLHVMNYTQLRLLGETFIHIPWLAVILDEGQYIKNPSSITAQIARQLMAKHRLILSGTPIENRLLDLWSLMSFAMPGALGSRAQFARLYDSKEDPFARKRLSSRVRPFLLRRTKTQVAKDLPDRIEEDLYCDIEGEQKTLYRAELKKAQQMLLRVKTQKQLAQERFHFLTSLLRLRQICCDPRLVNPETKALSAKTEALMEQLEPLMEEGQKVLVFSQFVTMLDLLKPEIQSRGWPHYYLAGETENRGDLVREFQAAEGGAVFLISLKAGGFGLNWTAANYVVLFDPWWNPAVENQAIDRTHRIGQKSKVIAYRLLIKDSIEEKIRVLQKTKSALASDVLGEEKFAQNLTLDDLHYLFSD